MFYTCVYNNPSACSGKKSGVCNFYTGVLLKNDEASAPTIDFSDEEAAAAHQTVKIKERK